MMDLQKQIALKFKYMSKIIEETNNDTTNNIKKDTISNIKTELDSLIKTYKFGITELEMESIFTDENFQLFLIKENVVFKITDILANLQHLVVKNSKIQSYINVCKNITLTTHVNDVLYDICSKCNVKMIKKVDDCMLCCVVCGITNDLEGTAEEEIAICNNEIQETKKQKYTNIIVKCAQTCLDYIQAKISTNISEKIIDKVKKCIHNDCINNMEKINCSLIRKYLKSISVDDYNNCVPLIYKIIRGVAPPQLSEKEEQTCISYFKLVIMFFDKTKLSAKSNRPYHFYFIYKILELIIDGYLVKVDKDNQDCEIDESETMSVIILNKAYIDLVQSGNCSSVEKKSNKGVWKTSQTKRKQDILSCIHLQSKDTLVKNDKFWKQLCEHIPEFVYKPTSRINMYN
jgi:hypothetical protein